MAVGDRFDPFTRQHSKVGFRRNPVVAAHPGEGPFIIPLRTFLIVVATGGV
jgi:hypothetical protein